LSAFSRERPAPAAYEPCIERGMVSPGMTLMADTSARIIADQAERERALDPSRSFIVQAPAGSGKTSLLVSRFLKLLSLTDKPEEVLAITFTRKAAAEMRKRVIGKLSNPGEIAHRLRIMTMDAFCASLTRQVPVLARFGAQPEIVEDASDLYFEAAFRTLGISAIGRRRVLAHWTTTCRRREPARGCSPSATSGCATPAARPARSWKPSCFSKIAFCQGGIAPEASAELAAELLTQKHSWRVRTKGPGTRREADAENPQRARPLLKFLPRNTMMRSGRRWRRSSRCCCRGEAAVRCQRATKWITEVAHAAVPRSARPTTRANSPLPGREVFASWWTNSGHFHQPVAAARV
jgi:hypothetical protein